MIGKSANSIRSFAFSGCGSLNSVYFTGNAPVVGSAVFLGAGIATVYYLPGTMGRWPTFVGRPPAPWVRPNPLILDFGPSFGVRTNGFSFIISWATNTAVVVEAYTDFTYGNWSSVATNLLSGGWSDFTDLQWTNYRSRFYRVRRP